MSYIGAAPSSATFSPSLFYANAQAITAPYTFPVGQNTMSIGPLTLSGSNVLTVPNGAVWKII